MFSLTNSITFYSVIDHIFYNIWLKPITCQSRTRCYGCVHTLLALQSFKLLGLSSAKGKINTPWHVVREGLCMKQCSVQSTVEHTLPLEYRGPIFAEVGWHSHPPFQCRDSLVHLDSLLRREGQLLFLSNWTTRRVLPFKSTCGRFRD